MIADVEMQLFMLFLIHAHNGRMIEMRPVPKPYLDGPWHLHWPCLIPWIMLEIPGSIAWLRNTDTFGKFLPHRSRKSYVAMYYPCLVSMSKHQIRARLTCRVALTLYSTFSYKDT